MGAGHYGIFSGRRWREQVYPTVREFIAKHGSGPLPKAGKAAAATSSTAMGCGSTASGVQGE